MNKTSLEDKRLSWKAKGILAYMLSKPDNWIFHIDELIRHSTDGKASFRSGFKELKTHGYVKRIRKRNKKGTFDWETVVYEKPHTDFPLVDKPQMEKPVVDNRTLLSTDELSTDELSIKEKETNIICDLFDHYLSKKIINHNKLTNPMKSAVKARLKDYSYEQLIQAIDNYAIVYKGTGYYFNTKYGFADLMRDKDVRKFIDEADPLNNLKDSHTKTKPKKINLEEFNLDD